MKGVQSELSALINSIAKYPKLLTGLSDADHSCNPCPDEERQLMCKEAQKTRDKNYARRRIAMLMLHQEMTVTGNCQTALSCAFIRRKMDKLVYFTGC
ncbi:hypothetical protein OS42_08990 [Dickeya oryzae]